MKFDITRTSIRFDHLKTTTPPCIDAHKLGDCWYINIDSLEELVDLVNREGSLIIDGGQSIEIYDDYRE